MFFLVIKADQSIHNSADLPADSMPRVRNLIRSLKRNLNHSPLRKSCVSAELCQPKFKICLTFGLGLGLYSRGYTREFRVSIWLCQCFNLTFVKIALKSRQLFPLRGYIRNVNFISVSAYFSSKFTIKSRHRISKTLLFVQFHRFLQCNFEHR